MFYMQCRLTVVESATYMSRWLMYAMGVINKTSGYATMVHDRGCNPHRSTTTFSNLKITSLWRHWWRHNSKTIRDREKRRPPRAMRSYELSNGENCIALRQLLQNRKWRHWWRHNLGSRRKLQKWLERILLLVRSTIAYNQKSGQSDQNCRTR